MQMSKYYETTDRRKRAQQAHEDAEACETAGFPGFAQVNREIAACLVVVPRDPEV